MLFNFFFRVSDVLGQQAKVWNSNGKQKYHRHIAFIIWCENNSTGLHIYGGFAIDLYHRKDCMQD